MNEILIDIEIDKEPYIKKITGDKVINLTGESGSGKTYFSNKYINDDDYIVIDTDIVFGKIPTQDKYNLELRNLFKNKSKEYLMTNFDDFYNKILKYFNNSNKTIVIDSAQFRNMKDPTKLKGTIIVIRTSINTCYKRCIERFVKKFPNATEDEVEKYSEKKRAMYNWYHSLNKLILKIDKL